MYINFIKSFKVKTKILYSKNITFFTIIIILFTSSIKLHSANYYVNDNDTSGDIYTTAVGAGGNDGTTPATPKPDLSDIILAYSLNPGDCVYVDNGIYNDKVAITVDDSGAPGNYVNIIGAGTNAGKHSVMTYTGPPPKTFGFMFDNASDVRVIGFDIKNYTQYGIHLKGNSKRILIERNTICSNGQRGIYIENGHYNTIFFNKIYHNPFQGIYLCQGSKRNTLNKNTIFSNGDGSNWEERGGILIGDSCSTNTIKNNIVYSNNLHGIILFPDWVNPQFNNSVYSNTVFGNESIGILLIKGGYHKVYANSIYRNSSRGITIQESTNNIIYGNIIGTNGTYFDEYDAGILFAKGANNNILKSNKIFNNNPYGVSFYHNGWPPEE